MMPQSKLDLRFNSKPKTKHQGPSRENYPSHLHSTVLRSVLPVASCCDQGKESRDARLDATMQQSFRQRAGQVLEEPE